MKPPVEEGVLIPNIPFNDTLNEKSHTLDQDSSTSPTLFEKYPPHNEIKHIFEKCSAHKLHRRSFEEHAKINSLDTKTQLFIYPTHTQISTQPSHSSAQTVYPSYNLVHTLHPKPISSNNSYFYELEKSQSPSIVDTIYSHRNTLETSQFTSTISNTPNLLHLTVQKPISPIDTVYSPHPTSLPSPLSSITSKIVSAPDTTVKTVFVLPTTPTTTNTTHTSYNHTPKPQLSTLSKKHISQLLPEKSPTVPASRHDYFYSSILLAAGHMNKFFVYPDSHGNPYYMLKVTTAKEAQFYTVLHALSKRSLKCFSTLSSLIGKKLGTTIRNEIELYEELSNIKKDFLNGSEILPEHSSQTLARHHNSTYLYSKNDALKIPPQFNTDAQKYQTLANILLDHIPPCYEAFGFELGGENDTLTNKIPIHIIKIKNLNYALKLPLILDIKMGKRLHGDDAPASKIARAEKKAQSRSLPTLGFSFSGMVGYNYIGDPIKIDGGSRSTSDSIETNPLTLDQYAQLISNRFLMALRSTELSIKVANFIIMEVKKILHTLQAQDLIAFYGSSLLFIVDSSITMHSDLSENVIIRMIDFANVSLWTKKIDEDYIFGLYNLLKALDLSKSYLSPS